MMSCPADFRFLLTYFILHLRVVWMSFVSVFLILFTEGFRHFCLFFL